MNDRQIVFLIKYKNEQYLQECISYICRLKIPKGYEVQILSNTGREEDYNNVISVCDAKYKVYMQETTFIINDYFIYDMVSLFRQNVQIGMLGILGSETDENKIQINECNYGRLLLGNEESVEEINLQSNCKYSKVQAVNEVLFATQYDLQWDETLENQYLIQQCKKYREHGWEIVIPYQKSSWCLCDCDSEKSELYCRYRFLLRNIEYWHDLQSAEILKKMLLENLLPVETLDTLMEHSVYARNIMNWYIKDLVSGTRKPEKYLLADGVIDIENRENNIIHIVTAFNEAWGVYAGVMLESLYENNSLARIHVHVLQKDVSENTKWQLMLQAEKYANVISFYDFKMESLPPNIKTTAFWTVEMYFRLFMIDMLSENIERVLYLDPDIIVSKPIYDLYFMNMYGKEVVGCREFNRKKDGFGDSRDKVFAFCINEDEFEYFNSGVMLLDLKQLRKKVCGKEYLKLIGEEMDDLMAMDQDLLNLMHWRNAGFVDEFRYDFFPITCFGPIRGMKKQEMLQTVAITHYGGQSHGGFGIYIWMPRFYGGIMR